MIAAHGMIMSVDDVPAAPPTRTPPLLWLRAGAEQPAAPGAAAAGRARGDSRGAGLSGGWRGGRAEPG